MQFFPILQGLERNGMVVDEQKGDGWAQRRGDWTERVYLYYIGKGRGVGQVFACVTNLMVRMGW